MGGSRIDGKKERQVHLREADDNHLKLRNISNELEQSQQPQQANSLKGEVDL